MERALALRDVMDHAVRVHRESTDPKPLGGGRRRARIVFTSVLCVALMALCAYSWVARPEFIWGPTARSVAPERREANIRFGMFLLAQRLVFNKKKAGGYPADLGSTGVAMPGVSYRLVSDSVFELRATENGKAIVYTSTQSPQAFLGDAPRLISGTPP